MIIRSIAFILILAFIACSPTKKLRRLLKKHPELLNIRDTATVIRVDTILINSITTDSTFHSSIDSFIIVKDKLRIVYRRIRDSIYIKGEYLGDTIIRIDTVRVAYNVAEVREPTYWEQVRGWIPLIIIICLIWLFRKALKKFFNL